MKDIQVWLAEADTDRVHAVEVFQNRESAKVWCDKMRTKYHADLDEGKWFEGDVGGIWKQRGSMAEFTYDLTKVKS